MRVLTLSNADIHAALSPADCERAMAGVLAARVRGEAFNPLRTVTVPPGAAGFIGLMPAYVSASAAGEEGPGYAGAAFGLKAICLIPGNPARGLDAHQGTVMLYDGETGMPTAILNASAITEIRTAAVTAVATRALARESARVLAMLGAGVQARSHLLALADVRPWDEVRVYAPTTAHAEALREVRPDITVAASAQDAVQGADVVTIATSAKRPVLRARLAGDRGPRQRRRRELAHRLGDRARDRRRRGPVLRQPRVGAQRGRGVQARHRAGPHLR